MIKDLLRWALPGAATVVAGTALGVLMTSASIANDVATRSIAAPEQAGFSWPQLRPEQRRVSLTNASAERPKSRSSLPIAPDRQFGASAVTTELAQAGSIVTLEPPRIADYWLSATLHADGAIIFDGYAPDEATKQALGAFTGADTTWLKLGRGAPESYRSAADFGMSALALLSEGRFSLRDNVVTLSGVARSAADYTALRNLIDAGAPQGMVLAQAEVNAPAIAQYTWSASKSADGTVSLDGFVPSPADAAALRAAAGQQVNDTQAYASGAPTSFITSAQTAIDLLQGLADGKIAYDGSGWVITGTPNSPADQTEIEAIFTSRQLASSGWSMALAQPVTIAAAPVAEPAPPTPAEPPIAAEPAPVAAPVAPAAPAELAPVAIDPAYTFSATTANGSIVLSGQVPTAVADELFAVAPGSSTDAVTFAEGAPADFLANAKAGLAALATLEQGRLDFAAGRWTISGAATSETSNTELAARINAVPDPSLWTVNTTAPEPVAPPVAPAPANAPADVAACSDVLAEFSARNAILFRSGAAIIATASEPALDELATDLSACPDAIVYVEGHTDSDGDEAQNLALSVARAESVVNALIARSVTPERLYAVGYGESKPIADNETPAGKQLNRRIVITVNAQHY